MITGVTMILSLILPFIILIPLPPPPVIESHIKTIEISSEVSCSCVSFVIQNGGKIPYIDARRMVATSTEPSVGSTALFYYPNSNLHHVALVKEVYEDSFLISEANYIHCATGTRVIMKNDNRLLGFL